jgi:peptidoglycan/xylan/chitin deacetylase (PgdA/CDA1 family)
MKFCLAFLSVLLVTETPVCAQQKQIAITIDDLPTVTYSDTDSTYQQQLTQRLIDAMKEFDIPGIGFVNEAKLYRQQKRVPYQINLLRQWTRAGLELGNHTYSHMDFNNNSMRRFGQNVIQGEKVTNGILSAAGMKLRYFRHPYLHTGSSKEKQDSLNLFLKEHHYTVAPVTIDNEDYVFAAAYQPAKDNKNLMLVTDITTDYVKYMEAKLVFYENQSQKLFGRNINQILLIHANLLNSDCLGALATMIKRHGYTFVSLDTALQDPAYQTPITAFGKWGISWIDRWALSQGKTGDFFAGEPETPAYIKTLAAGIPK